jgi:hypothetical protein
VLASSELLGLILLSLVELVHLSVYLVTHREITEVVVAQMLLRVVQELFSSAQLVCISLIRQLEGLDQTGEELLAGVVQVVGELLVLVQHLLYNGGHGRVEGHLGAWVLAQAEVALDYVLEKACRRLD